MKIAAFLLLLFTAHLLALEPLPLLETVVVNGIELNCKAPPRGLVLNEESGLLTVAAVKAQLVHRTQSRILETRAVITPKGDYLLMFPEGDHYAKSKGEKINSMMVCRSKDKGKTWSAPAVAYDIPYGQHGFIPLIPRGTQRIHCFGTQPIPGKWRWQEGQRENAPIGWRTSDDDGHTWSEVNLIEPVNDPGFMGMSVMRMTETDAGTWLLGSHLADWSVKPFTTCQYLLRSEDQGKTWTVLPGARPKGWIAKGFNRMDEGRPLNLGGGRLLLMSRTPQGHLFTAWSQDDGKTWTEPAPSTLVHPDAPPMLFPLSDGKTLVAFHHNKVPATGNGELSDKAERMKMRSEIWASLSTDEGHTWSVPRFVLANAVAPVHAVSGFNSQCSYLDAFTEDGVMHLFMPHRWQQVLQLTIRETALGKLPTKGALAKLASDQKTSSAAVPALKHRVTLVLPAVISDHMVLQGGKPVALWGWATAGDEITVAFAGQEKRTQTDASGRWRLSLDPLVPSRESKEMRINDKVIRDVLVGEVWLASGQSNMEMQINGKLHGKVDNADAEVADANHPGIRLFVHDSPFAIYELPVPADKPAMDRPGKWRVCSPNTVADCSAMAYFFARDLHGQLEQPIGILTAAVGGTPIEAWTSLSAQQDMLELKPLLADWTSRLEGFVPEVKQSKFLKSKAAWLKERSAAIKSNLPAPKAPAPFKNLQVMRPGALCAAMIAPLSPYTMRGVIWYQGERNAAGPFTRLYGAQLRLLIKDWRAHWASELHFAWVQLPAFGAVQKSPAEPTGWGVSVRDGQRRALDLPRTSMAISIDLGGETSGHPTNKVDYAKRLATAVLHDAYQKNAGLPTGPLFKSATIKNGRMILDFDHAEGLHPRSGALKGFGLADADGNWVWAQSVIENGQVVLWSDEISDPRTACYAWSANPVGNLVNAANLPTSPFITD